MDAANGNVDAIRRRICGANWKKNSRNLKAVRGALQVASRKGHEEVVRLLIDQYPDQVDLKSDGRTALHMASSFGHCKSLAF